MQEYLGGIEAKLSIYLSKNNPLKASQYFIIFSVHSKYYWKIQGVLTTKVYLPLFGSVNVLEIQVYTLRSHLQL